MKTIYKYEIKASLNQLSIPEDAEILTVQMQGDNPQLWVLLDTEKEKIYRYFMPFPTGGDMENILKGQYDQKNLHAYVGTFQMPQWGAELLILLYT
jgi:hypothetical protein